MGREVKNVVKSKYGLMGSSFSAGHSSSFWKNCGIGHPPSYTFVYVWGRAQGFFKRNSIISIRSKVMAFFMILLSPWSPCCPRHPHVIPVVPTLSPYPHVVSMAVVSVVSVVSTPCCPHVVPVVPTSSPSSCRSRHPCVIPVIPTSSP